MSQILAATIGVVAYFILLFAGDRALAPKWRPYGRLGAGVLTIGGFFYALHVLPYNFEAAVSISKGVIAVVAALCVFYEAQRKAEGRPVAERWKKLIGIGLALAAITAYFDGYRFGYDRYYHRHDQYHYYMGAKYFPELGYKKLYQCAVVAEKELGTMSYQLDRAYNAKTARTLSLDFGAEIRDPDKKIRDLPGRNLLIPVTELLEHPETCKDRFSPERWEQYKKDVAFFRIVSGKGYWDGMQKDHGFNPPPVWTIAGKFFSVLEYSASVKLLQFLATLDIIYLLGMFVALWWGFGWRVFAVGAIFWGCQASAPFYWTGGAFLRQDWLFFSVLSVACIRKRHFKVAGATLVYAGLLRIFPGLVVIGTLVPVIAYAIRQRRMHRDHLQMLIGGCAAAAVLLSLSIVMTHHNPNKPFYTPYVTFYKHTIETHDKTPLTNHMGLRVIIGHKFIALHAPGLRTPEEAAKWRSELTPTARKVFGWMGRIRFPVSLARGKDSGQMQYVTDNSLLDPFQPWKDMRNERYHRFRYVAYALILGTLAFFGFVLRNVKSLWIAQCLGQIFIILLSQLTCYYYAFMILAAPLIKVRRQVEIGLFGLAAITQIIFRFSHYNDNKYTLLTIASLVFCYAMLGMFWRRAERHVGATDPAKVDSERGSESDDPEGHTKADAAAV